MANWWKKKLPLGGSVLFRGDLPPQPEDFTYLQSQGFAVKSSPNKSQTAWSLNLSHPEWGEAVLSYEATSLSPHVLLEFSHIPQQDKDAAMSAQIMVTLSMESRHEHVLRDRKAMLRILRAVMGNDGLVVIDNVSSNVWTREHLDEELSHDADLDVEGIYSLHAITEDDKVYWLHTHGLSEIGAFDFDIFNPSPEVRAGVQDLCRCIAFHILEGNLKPQTQQFSLMVPNGRIRLVEMEYFLSHADPAIRKDLATDVDQYHRKNHSVICDPEERRLGLLFGKKVLRTPRFLTKAFPENLLLNFSTSASELMAERARNTYPMLRALREEFADFEFPCLVKLGFRIDGGSETDREHIWMLVHDLLDDELDATCANEPYKVSGLKEGQRGRHSVNMMSDWVIFTPFGSITPRSTTASRMVRANPDLARNLMEDK